jgi:hypothetical protein
MYLLSSSSVGDRHGSISRIMAGKTGGAGAGGNILLQSGNSVSESGGTVIITSGASKELHSGSMYLKSSDGYLSGMIDIVSGFSNNKPSGEIEMVTLDSYLQDSGDIRIYGGHTHGSNSISSTQLGGDIKLESGSSEIDGIGGNMYLKGGQGINGGFTKVISGMGLTYSSGKQVFAAGSGVESAGGYFSMSSSSISTGKSSGFVNGDSGNSLIEKSGLISIRSGMSAIGGSGDLNILSGKAAKHDGGSIVLASGTSKESSGGMISMKSGVSKSAGNSGSIFIVVEDGVTQGGHVKLTTGNAVSGEGSGSTNVLLGPSYASDSINSLRVYQGTGVSEHKNGNLRIFAGPSIGNTGGIVKIESGGNLRQLKSGNVYMQSEIGISSGKVGVKTGISLLDAVGSIFLESGIGITAR